MGTVSLHVAGAGARPAHRRAHRPVLARHGAVPDGDRRAAVPGRHLGGGLRGDPQPRPAAARAGRTRRCRRSSRASSDKALEKDRDLRYQTATDLKTDLLRLQARRSTRAAGARPSPARRAPAAPAKAAERSVAVLYFENLSGVKEDEYFRDGITEDIITELSKIKGLKIFSRADGARLPRQAGDAGADRPAARRGVRAGGQPAARRATACASTPSSSTRRPTSRSGPSATTARCRTCSRCRTRSRARSPRRCA